VANAAVPWLHALSAANRPIALHGGVQQNSSFLLLLFPDGVDGKQARRTNSSTPLGELFDHGLDSWACVYFVVTVYSTFGRGSTGVSVFVLYLLLWVVLFSFILSHWEKYNTGILFLPWGYDISQVVSTRRAWLQQKLHKLRVQSLVNPSLWCSVEVGLSRRGGGGELARTACVTSSFNCFNEPGSRGTGVRLLRTVQSKEVCAVWFLFCAE